MKLAIIGGGSTYTPELVDGFARLREQLPVEQLALIDPDPQRLEAVGAVSRRILAKQGHPGQVLATSNVAEGLEGADAVLFQLRVGGQAARNVDETLPLDFCCVGQETTGAGGLAKALRTVPVVLDLAEQVRRYAPHARIVDFTNPVGIVTRALLDAGHDAVGLCNVAIGFQRRFAASAGVAPGAVQLDHVGLNHLTWIRGVRIAGEEALPEIIENQGEEISGDLEMPAQVLRDLNAIPSYYLRYYYEHDAVVRELRESESRAQQVADMERRLLEMYLDPSVDTKPELLAKRGGAFYSEAAVELIASLTKPAGEADVRVVNLRNRGTLPFLDDDAVIEVSAKVGADGIEALPQRPLPAHMRGLIAHVSAYEELALDAALHGGRDRVVQALLAHPLIGQYDLANRLGDALIAANRRHLPWAGER
ncbi:6-phospho-beta-glucosidase [Actinospica durhamensis]|uniref:6-phospho-beta-glucosidase n=1 Tax=Actinospica durhamensis TaxID=1508375 RepID=A0A941IRV7_9ACTN|nr:6-phospho-beta-glucosidase [Actinospica durhamensis]MBR7832646.1 6-phospho-beta-glucosidase [Actinospica durhamensis]